MTTQNGRPHFLWRLTALGVLTTFLLTSRSTPPAYAQKNLPAPPLSKIIPTDLSQIRIPEKIGRVQEFFKGAKDQTVVLIQDAHAVPEAQRSIQKLIEYFQNEYGIDRVALEGASLQLDAQFLKSFPNKKVFQKLIEDFFEKGELTGGNAAALFSGRGLFQGVEDGKLYEEGIRLYLEAFGKAPALLTEMNRQKSKLESEKQAIYSPQLLEIDRAIEKFQIDHENLEQVLKMAGSFLRPPKGSGIETLLEDLEKNKGEWGRDELEREKKYSQISGRFSEEFETYVRNVKDRLFRNDVERKLDRESRRLYLFKKLVQLELTREEWEEVKPLQTQAEMAGHRTFYENAEKRETAFFENLRKMAGGHPALFIAGGFHAEGMTRRLKEAGISVVLVAPQIEGLPQNNFYQTHMRGDVSWKGYFKVENGKINVYEAFARAARDKLLQSSSPNASVKLWRDQIIRDLAAGGKIERAGEYTRFLDELKARDFRAQWLAHADRFVDGLRRLEASQQLTSPNILKLLEPATVPAWPDSLALSPEYFHLPPAPQRAAKNMRAPETTAGLGSLRAEVRVENEKIRAEEESGLLKLASDLLAEAGKEGQDIEVTKKLNYAAWTVVHFVKKKKPWILQDLFEAGSQWELLPLPPSILERLKQLEITYQLKINRPTWKSYFWNFVTVNLGVLVLMLSVPSLIEIWTYHSLLDQVGFPSWGNTAIDVILYDVQLSFVAAGTGLIYSGGVLGNRSRILDQRERGAFPVMRQFLVILNGGFFTLTAFFLHRWGDFLTTLLGFSLYFIFSHVLIHHYLMGISSHLRFMTPSQKSGLLEAAARAVLIQNPEIAYHLIDKAIELKEVRTLRGMDRWIQEHLREKLPQLNRSLREVKRTAQLELANEFGLDARDLQQPEKFHPSKKIYWEVLAALSWTPAWDKILKEALAEAWKDKVPDEAGTRFYQRYFAPDFEKITGPLLDAAAAQAGEAIKDRQWSLESPPPSTELLEFLAAVRSYRKKVNGFAKYLSSRSEARISLDTVNASEFFERFRAAYAKEILKWNSGMQEWQASPIRNPTIGAGVFLLRKIKGEWHFLIVKQKYGNENTRGRYVIPAGKVDQPASPEYEKRAEISTLRDLKLTEPHDFLPGRESVFAAALRELEEETGVKGRIAGRLDSYTSLLGMYINYFIHIDDSGSQALPGLSEEVEDPRWVPLKIILNAGPGEAGEAVQEFLGESSPLIGHLKRTGINLFRDSLQTFSTSEMASAAESSAFRWGMAAGVLNEWWKNFKKWIYAPSKESEKRIRWMRQALEENTDPNLLGVLIFGGTARGKADEESDIDYLLIKQKGGFPQIGLDDETSIRFYEALKTKQLLAAGHPFKVEVIRHTPAAPLILHSGDPNPLSYFDEVIKRIFLYNEKMFGNPFKKYSPKSALIPRYVILTKEPELESLLQRLIELKKTEFSPEMRQTEKQPQEEIGNLLKKIETIASRSEARTIDRERQVVELVLKIGLTEFDELERRAQRKRIRNLNRLLEQDPNPMDVMSVYTAFDSQQGPENSPVLFDPGKREVEAVLPTDSSESENSLIRFFDRLGAEGRRGSRLRLHDTLVKVMILGLLQPNQKVRYAAVRALLDLPEEQRDMAAPLLNRMAEDPRSAPIVIYGLIRLFEEHKDVPSLARLLKSPKIPPLLIRKAIEAIGNLAQKNPQDKAAIEALVKTIFDFNSNPGILIQAMNELAKNGPPDIAALILASLIMHSDDEISSAADRAFALLAPNVDRLIAEARSKRGRSEVRSAPTRTFRQIADFAVGHPVHYHYPDLEPLRNLFLVLAGQRVSAYEGAETMARDPQFEMIAALQTLQRDGVLNKREFDELSVMIRRYRNLAKFGPVAKEEIELIFNFEIETSKWKPRSRKPFEVRSKNSEAVDAVLSILRHNAGKLAMPVEKRSPDFEGGSLSLSNSAPGLLRVEDAGAGQFFEVSISGEGMSASQGMKLYLSADGNELLISYPSGDFYKTVTLKLPEAQRPRAYDLTVGEAAHRSEVRTVTLSLQKKTQFIFDYGPGPFYWVDFILAGKRRLSVEPSRPQVLIPQSEGVPAIHNVLPGQALRIGSRGNVVLNDEGIEPLHLEVKISAGQDKVIVTNHSTHTDIALQEGFLRILDPLFQIKRAGSSVPEDVFRKVLAEFSGERVSLVKDNRMAQELRKKITGFLEKDDLMREDNAMRRSFFRNAWILLPLYQKHVEAVEKAEAEAADLFSFAKTSHFVAGHTRWLFSSADLRKALDPEEIQRVYRQLIKKAPGGKKTQEDYTIRVILDLQTVKEGKKWIVDAGLKGDRITLHHAFQDEEVFYSGKTFSVEDALYGNPSKPETRAVYLLLKKNLDLFQLTEAYLQRTLKLIEKAARSEVRKMLTEEERARIQPRYKTLREFFAAYPEWRKAHPEAKLVFFGRHGESMSNFFKYSQSYDFFSPLTLRGHAQAKAMAAFFDKLFKKKDFRFDRYIASNLERAYRSLGYLAAAAGTKPEILNRLREVLLHPVGGIPMKIIEKRFPDLWKKFTQNPADFNIEDFYSGQKVDEYLKLLIRDLETDPAKHVLMTTHGMTLLLALMSFFKIPYEKYEDFWPRLGNSPHLGMTVLAYLPETKSWELMVYGDDSYLPEGVQGPSKRLADRAMNLLLYYMTAVARFFFAPDEKTLSDTQPAYRAFFPFSEKLALQALEEFEKSRLDVSEEEEKLKLKIKESRIQIQQTADWMKKELGEEAGPAFSRMLEKAASLAKKSMEEKYARDPESKKWRETRSDFLWFSVRNWIFLSVAFSLFGFPGAASAFASFSHWLAFSEVFLIAGAINVVLSLHSLLVIQKFIKAAHFFKPAGPARGQKILERVWARIGEIPDKDWDDTGSYRSKGDLRFFNSGYFLFTLYSFYSFAVFFQIFFRFPSEIVPAIVAGGYFVFGLFNVGLLFSAGLGPNTVRIFRQTAAASVLSAGFLLGAYEWFYGLPWGLYVSAGIFGIVTGVLRRAATFFKEHGLRFREDPDFLETLETQTDLDDLDLTVRAIAKESREIDSILYEKSAHAEEDISGFSVVLAHILLNPHLQQKTKTAGGPLRSEVRAAPQQNEWLSKTIRQGEIHDRQMKEINLDNFPAEMLQLNNMLRKEKSFAERIERRLTDDGSALDIFHEHLKDRVFELPFGEKIDLVMISLPLVALNELSKNYWPGFSDYFKKRFHEKLTWEYELDAAYYGTRIEIAHYHSSDAQTQLFKIIQEVKNEMKTELAQMGLLSPRRVKEFARRFDQVMERLSIVHARLSFKTPPAKPPLPDPSDMIAYQREEAHWKPREISQNEFEAMTQTERKKFVEDYDKARGKLRKKWFEAAGYWLKKTREEEPANIRDGARPKANFFIERILYDALERLYERGEVLEKATGGLEKEIRGLIQAQVKGQKNGGMIPVFDQKMVEDLVKNVRGKPASSQFYEAVREGRRGTPPIFEYKGEGTLPLVGMPRRGRLTGNLKRSLEKLESDLQSLETKRTGAALKRFKNSYQEYQRTRDESLVLAYRDPRLRQYYKREWIHEVVKADSQGLLAKLQKRLLSFSADPGDKFEDLAELIEPGLLPFKRPVGDEAWFAVKTGPDRYGVTFSELNWGRSFFLQNPPDEEDTAYHRILLAYLEKQRKHQAKKTAVWWKALEQFDPAIRWIAPQLYPTKVKVMGERRPGFVRPQDASGYPTYARDREDRLLKIQKGKGPRWKLAKDEPHDLEAFVTSLSAASSYEDQPVNADQVDSIAERLEALADVQKRNPEWIHRVMNAGFLEKNKLRSEMRTIETIQRFIKKNKGPKLILFQGQPVNAKELLLDLVRVWRFADSSHVLLASVLNDVMSFYRDKAEYKLTGPAYTPWEKFLQKEALRKPEKESWQSAETYFPSFLSQERRALFSGKNGVLVVQWPNAGEWLRDKLGWEILGDSPDAKFLDIPVLVLSTGKNPQSGKVEVQLMETVLDRERDAALRKESLIIKSWPEFVKVINRWIEQKEGIHEFRFSFAGRNPSPWRIIDQPFDIHKTGTRLLHFFERQLKQAGLSGALEKPVILVTFIPEGKWHRLEMTFVDNDERRSEVRAQAFHKTREEFLNEFRRVVQELGKDATRNGIATGMKYKSPDAMMNRARKLKISFEELRKEGMPHEQMVNKDDFLKRLKEAVAELGEKATRMTVAEKMGYKQPVSFVRQAAKLGISRQDLEEVGVYFEDFIRMTAEREWFMQKIAEIASNPEEKRKWAETILVMSDLGRIHAHMAYVLLKALRTGKATPKDLDRPAAKEAEIGYATMHKFLIGQTVPDTVKKYPNVMDFLAQAANIKKTLEEKFPKKARRETKYPNAMTLLHDKYFFAWQLESLMISERAALSSEAFFETLMAKIPKLPEEQKRVVRGFLQIKTINYSIVGTKFKKAVKSSEIKKILMGSTALEARDGLYEKFREVIAEDDTLNSQFSSLADEAKIEKEKFTGNFFRWLRTKRSLGAKETGFLTKLLLYDASRLPKLHAFKFLSLAQRRKVFRAYFSGLTVKQIVKDSAALLGDPEFETKPLGEQAVKDWFSKKAPAARSGGIERLQQALDENHPVQEFRKSVRLYEAKAKVMLDPSTTDAWILNRLRENRKQNTRTHLFLKLSKEIADPAEPGLEKLFLDLIHKTLEENERELDSARMVSLFAEKLAPLMAEESTLKARSLLKTLLASAYWLRGRIPREKAVSFFVKLVRQTEFLLLKDEVSRKQWREMAAHPAKLYAEENRLMELLAREIQAVPQNLYLQGLYVDILQKIFNPLRVIPDEEAQAYASGVRRRPRTLKRVIAESERFDFQVLKKEIQEHNRRADQQQRIYAYFYDRYGRENYESKWVMKHLYRYYSFMILHPENNPRGIEISGLLAEAYQVLGNAAYDYKAPGYFSEASLRVSDPARRRLQITALEEREAFLQRHIPVLEQELNSEPGPAEEKDHRKKMAYELKNLKVEQTLKSMLLMAYRAEEAGQPNVADQLFQKAREFVQTQEEKLITAMFAVYMKNRMGVLWQEHRQLEKVLSLENEIAGSDDGKTHRDELADKEAEPEVFAREQIRELREKIDSILDNPRENQIFRLANGLDPIYSGIKLSWDDIAHILAFREGELFTNVWAGNIYARAKAKIFRGMAASVREKTEKEWLNFFENLGFGETVDPEPLPIIVMPETGTVKVAGRIEFKGLSRFAGKESATLTLKLINYERNTSSQDYEFWKLPGFQNPMKVYPYDLHLGIYAQLNEAPLALYHLEYLNRGPGQAPRVRLDPITLPPPSKKSELRELGRKRKKMDMAVFGRPKDSRAYNVGLGNFYTTRHSLSRVWKEAYPQILILTDFDSSGTLGLFGEAVAHFSKKLYANVPVDVHLQWSPFADQYKVISVKTQKDRTRTPFKTVWAPDAKEDYSLLLDSFHQNLYEAPDKSWKETYPRILIRTTLDRNGGLNVLRRKHANFGKPHAPVEVYLEWSGIQNEYLVRRVDFKIPKKKEMETIFFHLIEKGRGHSPLEELDRSRLEQTFYGGIRARSYLFDHSRISEGDRVWMAWPRAPGSSVFLETFGEKPYRFEGIQAADPVYGVYEWRKGAPHLTGIWVKDHWMFPENLPDFSLKLDAGNKALIERLHAKVLELWSDEDFQQTALLAGLEGIAQGIHDFDRLLSRVKKSVRQAFYKKRYFPSTIGETGNFSGSTAGLRSEARATPPYVLYYNEDQLKDVENLNETVLLEKTNYSTDMSHFFRFEGAHGKYLAKEALTEKEEKYLRNEALIMKDILDKISDPSNPAAKTLEEKKYHNPHLRLGVWDPKGKRLVVPYLEGKNAKDYFIGSTGHFDPVYKYLYAASKIVSPVSILHRLNIVHRDIKPSNYFVIEDNLIIQIILIDFNLAYRKGSGDPIFTAGTKGFAPPEQWIEGREPEFTDDVYALGVTLLQIWLGTEFGEDESRTVVYDFSKASPQAILEHTNFKGNPLEAILKRAIDPDPNVRYKSAVEMEAAIHDRMRQLKIDKESLSRSAFPAQKKARRKSAAPLEKFTQGAPELSLPENPLDEAQARILVQSLDHNLKFLSIEGMDDTQVRYKVWHQHYPDQTAILKIPVGKIYWNPAQTADGRVKNLNEARKRIKSRDLLAGMQAKDTPYLPRLLKYYEVRIPQGGSYIYSYASLAAEPEGMPVEDYFPKTPEGAKILTGELAQMIFTLAKLGLSLVETPAGPERELGQLRMTESGKIRIADRDVLRQIPRERAETLREPEVLKETVARMLEKSGVQRDSFAFDEIFREALRIIRNDSVTVIAPAPADRPSDPEATQSEEAPSIKTPEKPAVSSLEILKPYFSDEAKTIDPAVSDLDYAKSVFGDLILRDAKRRELLKELLPILAESRKKKPFTKADVRDLFDWAGAYSRNFLLQDEFSSKDERNLFLKRVMKHRIPQKYLSIASQAYFNAESEGGKEKVFLREYDRLISSLPKSKTFWPLLVHPSPRAGFSSLPVNEGDRFKIWYERGMGLIQFEVLDPEIVLQLKNRGLYSEHKDPSFVHTLLLDRIPGRLFVREHQMIYPAHPELKRKAPEVYAFLKALPAQALQELEARHPEITRALWPEEKQEFLFLDIAAPGKLIRIWPNYNASSVIRSYTDVPLSLGFRPVVLGGESVVLSKELPSQRSEAREVGEDVLHDFTSRFEKIDSKISQADWEKMEKEFSINQLAILGSKVAVAMRDAGQIFQSFFEERRAGILKIIRERNSRSEARHVPEKEKAFDFNLLLQDKPRIAKIVRRVFREAGLLNAGGKLKDPKNTFSALIDGKKFDALEGRQWAAFVDWYRQKLARNKPKEVSVFERILRDAGLMDERTYKKIIRKRRAAAPYPLIYEDPKEAEAVFNGRSPRIADPSPLIHPDDPVEMAHWKVRRFRKLDRKEEAQLLRLVKKGNSAALEIFVEHYYQAIYRKALRYFYKFHKEDPLIDLSLLLRAGEEGVRLGARKFRKMSKDQYLTGWLTGGNGWMGTIAAQMSNTVKTILSKKRPRKKEPPAPKPLKENQSTRLIDRLKDEEEILWAISLLVDKIRTIPVSHNASKLRNQKILFEYFGVDPEKKQLIPPQRRRDLAFRHRKTPSMIGTIKKNFIRKLIKSKEGKLAAFLFLRPLEREKFGIGENDRDLSAFGDIFGRAGEDPARSEMRQTARELAMVFRPRVSKRLRKTAVNKRKLAARTELYARKWGVRKFSETIYRSVDVLSPFFEKEAFAGEANPAVLAVRYRNAQAMMAEIGKAAAGMNQGVPIAVAIDREGSVLLPIPVSVDVLKKTLQRFSGILRKVFYISDYEVPEDLRKIGIETKRLASGRAISGKEPVVLIGKGRVSQPGLLEMEARVEGEVDTVTAELLLNMMVLVGAMMRGETLRKAVDPLAELLKQYPGLGPILNSAGVQFRREGERGILTFAASILQQKLSGEQFQRAA